MAFVDTNVLLRWLLGDHKELSPKAEELIKHATPATLLITDIVVAEIVYVLRSTGRDREQTSEALLLLERTEAFRYENKDLILEIIGLLTELKLDFADCYLLARARRESVAVETFDKALGKALTK
jgi:predicted nucleic acid-binding protein